MLLAIFVGLIVGLAGNQTTPAPTSPAPATPTDSSKLCLGPNEGTPAAASPILTDEYCVHFQYFNGQNPHVHERITWGGNLVDEDDLTPGSEPKKICTNKHNCDVCLGLDMDEITEHFAKMCPKVYVKCPFVPEVGVPMGCRTFGDEDTDETMSISHGLTSFGLRLLKTVTLTKDMDTFAAPFAVANTLLTTALSAGGNSRTQITDLLGLKDICTCDEQMAEIAESYGGMTNSLKHKGSIQASSDSNLWIAKKFYPELSDTFIANFHSFGESKELDIAEDPEMATGEVNAFVAEHTAGKIDKAIQSGLTPQSVYLFTNCMHFMANWEYPFNILATETFTDAKKEEISVDVMLTDPVSVEVSFTDKGEIMELPLKHNFGNFGFFVIKGKNGKDTIEIEKELQEEEFQDFLVKSHTVTRKVTMPEFKMYYTQDLTDEIKSMGVTDVFDRSKSNMTNLFAGGKSNAYVDGINRQGWIEVTQHGVQVAAFAGDGVGHEEATSGKVMHADEPFVFMIFDKNTWTLMFAGRITNPLGWKLDEHAHYRRRRNHGFVVFFFIMFFGTLAYCGVRICYNYQYHDLAGADAVPHIECIEGCVANIMDCCEGCYWKCRSCFGQEEHPIRYFADQPVASYRPPADEGTAYSHLDNQA